MSRIKAMKKSCGDTLASLRVFMKCSFAGIPGWCWTVLVVGVILLIISLWDWLQGEENQESPSDTLRNVMLFLTPPVALWLAIWRNRVADKQANVSQQQANVAQQQANVAQKGLQNERYQRSAEMLGSDTLATRIGGIYALERLAREHQKEYHIQIMDLLCAFVRHPKIRDDDAENEAQFQKRTNLFASDVQEALTVIGRRNQEQLDLEKGNKKWQLNLSQARLEGAVLWKAHLERAHLWNAHLERADLEDSHLEGTYLEDAHLEGADLTNAHLEDADMENAHLEGANLRNAHLKDAYLVGAHLGDVKGLTQAMLDKAAHYESEGKLLPSPNLEEAVCASSGELLVWRNPPKP